MHMSKIISIIQFCKLNIRFADFGVPWLALAAIVNTASVDALAAGNSPREPGGGPEVRGYDPDLDSGNPARPGLPRYGPADRFSS